MSDIEVVINGVRYLPAREVSGGVEDLRQALLDVFWGGGYRGSNPEDAEQGLYVSVYDDESLGGEPFEEFMNAIVAKLGREKVTP